MAGQKPARRPGRRQVGALMVGAAVATVVMSVAVAAWLATTAAGSAARSRAMTMPAGNKPTATVNPPAGSTVEISWVPSTGGAPVTAYEVRSYDADTGTPRIVGAACAGLVTGTSCTEVDVPDGSWRYSVVPRLEAWRGAESPLSDPVIVDSSYRALVVSDAPGAYWRLGESSGTTAFDEMGASDGTYAGGYTLGVPGALANDPNTSVDLNGSSGRISAPSVPALDLTSRVSIEAWVNPDSLAGTRWIVNKGTYYYLYIANGTTIFGVHAGGAYLFVTTTQVTTGAWQHLVGTYDGSELVLYRNGVVVAQAPATGAISSTTTPLFIGAVAATGSYFDGRIDEVAVYGSALTPPQVLAHYQRGNSTRPAVTVTFPAFGGAYANASWNAGCSTGGGDICGTAADTGGGVASVAVSVRQGSGNYWNGTAFSSATEVLLPATGTTSWTLGFPATNFPAEGSYTVRAVATDGAGNSGSAIATFTIDRTSPAPTAVTLVNADGVVTPGTDEVRITFSEPLNVSSICSAWSGTGDQTLGGSGVVVTITDNLLNDTLTVTAGACTLNIGSVATGGDYVVATSTFSGSTAATESRVTWTAATSLLTIHIGTQASGVVNVTPQSAGTVTYTPDAAITDPAGNPVVTAPFASSGQRF